MHTCPYDLVFSARELSAEEETRIQTLRKTFDLLSTAEDASHLHPDERVAMPASAAALSVRDLLRIVADATQHDAVRRPVANALLHAQ